MVPAYRVDLVHVLLALLDSALDPEAIQVGKQVIENLSRARVPLPFAGKVDELVLVQQWCRTLRSKTRVGFQ